MFRRQTDIAAGHPQGLLQPEPQSVLVAARDQCRASGGTHGRIGVGLQETNASQGNAVDVWRAEVGASVTGHVGIAEVVSKDEDDVGRPCRRLSEYIFNTRSKRKC